MKPICGVAPLSYRGGVRRFSPILLFLSRMLYLSPMFKKLRTVVYHVTDLEKAKEWYRHITGIDPYFDMPFYVGFDINGCELGLDPDGSSYTDGNHSYVYWSVDAIHDCVSKLLEGGAKMLQPVNEVGDNIKVAAVLDPWGNAVGLIEEG